MPTLRNHASDWNLRIPYRPDESLPADAITAGFPVSPLFRWLHVICDGIALVAAWFVASEWCLWYGWSALPAPPLRSAVPSLGGMLLLWVVTATWLTIYAGRLSPHVSHRFREAGEAILTISTLAIILVVVSHAAGFENSRPFLPVFAVASLAFLIPSFYGARALASALEARWYCANRTAIIGAPEDARALLASRRYSIGGNLRLVGLIVPDEGALTAESAALPILGSTRALPQIVSRQRIRRIILAGSSLDHERFRHYEGVSDRLGVTISCPIPVSSPARVSRDREYGIQFLELKAASRAPREPLSRRLLDIAGALFLLCLFSPVLCVIALLVKITSPGPVFYRSVRVGCGGRYFTFWKFRSMYHGSSRSGIDELNEQQGHLFKIRKDPRITRVGRFLRRHSLDELPQFFNVLRGDMSIVGPRPLPVEDLDPDGLSSRFRHWAEERARVRPGITGLWQTRGRSDLSFDEMVQFDIEYVQKRSLALDLRIILETPIVMCSGRGAY